VRVLIPAAQRKELSEEAAFTVLCRGGVHSAGILM
jgi:hypothetical protein